MSRMPREPEAFSEYVAAMFHRLCPDREINQSGVFELIINGRHLGLENLYRMVLYDPDRGVEIVEEYLDHLLEGEIVSSTTFPLDIAKYRIMPRIQPMSIFEHLDSEQVAYTPFVNDTVILYVYDMPHVTVSITTEQLIKWGIEVEELDNLARANLYEYRDKLSLKMIEPSKGGRAIIFSEQDGYDASRLLLRNLYQRLAPQLGDQFLVATPSRDTFLAVTAEPSDLVERIHSRISTDFRRLPYPITNRYFVVTLDGIAGTIAA